MIEKTVLDYLIRQFNGTDVSVYMEFPEYEHPSTDFGKFIIIEKTGSGESNHISQAMIAIQSYAESTAQAARLNEAVKTAMKGIIALDEITKVKCNSDYNYPDTTRKLPRYQAVFDLTFYE